MISNIISCNESELQSIIQEIDYDKIPTRFTTLIIAIDCLLSQQDEEQNRDKINLLNDSCQKFINHKWPILSYNEPNPFTNIPKRFLLNTIIRLKKEGYGYKHFLCLIEPNFILNICQICPITKEELLLIAELLRKEDFRNPYFITRYIVLLHKYEMVEVFQNFKHKIIIDIHRKSFLNVNKEIYQFFDYFIKTAENKKYLEHLINDQYIQFEESVRIELQCVFITILANHNYDDEAISKYNSLFFSLQNKDLNKLIFLIFSELLINLNPSSKLFRLLINELKYNELINIKLMNDQSTYLCINDALDNLINNSWTKEEFKKKIIEIFEIIIGNPPEKRLVLGGNPSNRYENQLRLLLNKILSQAKNNLGWKNFYELINEPEIKDHLSNLSKIYGFAEYSNCESLIINAIDSKDSINLIFELKIQSSELISKIFNKLSLYDNFFKNQEITQYDEQLFDLFKTFNVPDENIITSFSNLLNKTESGSKQYTTLKSIKWLNNQLKLLKNLTSNIIYLNIELHSKGYTMLDLNNLLYQYKFSTERIDSHDYQYGPDKILLFDMIIDTIKLRPDEFKEYTLSHFCTLFINYIIEYPYPIILKVKAEIEDFHIRPSFLNEKNVLGRKDGFILIKFYSSLSKDLIQEILLFFIFIETIEPEQLKEKVKFILMKKTKEI
jgi:hypothetical protein